MVQCAVPRVLGAGCKVQGAVRRVQGTGQGSLVQLLCRNVQRFRGGFVLKAHRRLYHSTLDLRVLKMKKILGSGHAQVRWENVHFLFLSLSYRALKGDSDLRELAPQQLRRVYSLSLSRSGTRLLFSPSLSLSLSLSCLALKCDGGIGFSAQCVECTMQVVCSV